MVKVAIFFASFLLCFSARAEQPEPSLKPLLDPHYGEVLYHFYQQDYFTAIVKLLAAKNQQQLLNHEAEAELLLAGLYLAYGLHKKAQPIFQRLLQREPRAVRQRAWYLLAEMSYRRGYRVAAESALKQIKFSTDAGSVGSEWQAKSRLLLAQIQSQTGQRSEALQTLNTAWPDQYARYAFYNRAMIGFAVDKKQALQQLRSLADLSVENSEQVALKDRANLTLGLFALREKRLAAAETALLKVSLNGLHSSRALLALGWSRLHQQRYAAALSPWLQLAERSADDLAVQEVWLAIPELLMLWQKPARAAEYYQRALRSLQQASEQLEQTRVLLRDSQWLMDLSILGDSQGHYGLPQLLASHDLQEALWDYRELTRLEGNLQQWRQKIIALNAFAVKSSEQNSVQSVQRRLSGISTRLQGLLPKWRNYVKRLADQQLQKQAARLQRLIQQSKLARAESLERVKDEVAP